MSVYLTLNLLIIAFPLILSFERKIQYYKKIIFLTGSILLVSTAFIIWDILAVLRKDWGFNHEYISGLNIINLPVEEILFFITVPYSILFIYETISLYFKDSKVHINEYIPFTISALLLITAGFHTERYYTFTVLIFTSIFLLSSLLWFKDVLYSKNYWLLVAISYIPFFIFNYILTSLPVVWYSPQAILGIRILSIPIEDFFYSYTLVSSYLLVYLTLKNRWPKRKVQQ